MLKLAMIADDLTGANDSGVQLARYGLNTSVLFELDETAFDQDAVVIDTDSRWLPQSQAYDKVKKASQVLKSGSFDVIYKKVDSTLRGNLGTEIDALYDVFHPDFVVIAPAYPRNGRTTVKGIHYLYGKPLGETEIARDPKTPVRDSYIPSIVQGQSERPVALVTYEELRSGFEQVQAKLKQCREDQIRYIVFDAEREEDLRLIVQLMSRSGHSVCWVGSAGLANYLPEVYGLQPKRIELDIPRDPKPVLLVAGSVSSTTRKQLDIVLEQPHIKGIEMRSSFLVADEASREAEMQRVYEQAKRALEDQVDIALFSSGRPEDIEEAQRLGKKERNGRKCSEQFDIRRAGNGHFPSHRSLRSKRLGVNRRGYGKASLYAAWCDRISSHSRSGNRYSARPNDRVQAHVCHHQSGGVRNGFIAA